MSIKLLGLPFRKCPIPKCGMQWVCGCDRIMALTLRVVAGVLFAFFAVAHPNKMKTVTKEDAVLSLSLLREAEQLIHDAAMGMAKREIGDIVNCDPIRALPGASKHVNASYNEAELTFLRRAIELLDNSIAANPYVPAAHVALATAHAEISGDINDCLASFDNALNLDPGDLDVLVSKTWCLIDHNRFEDASAEISRLESLRHPRADRLRRELTERKAELERDVESPHP